MHRFYGGLISLSMVVTGTMLSLNAYRFPQMIPNYYQAVGSIVFWAGAFIFVVVFLLGSAPVLALRFAKSTKGAAVGVAYLMIHLLLYGFVLEGILVSLYGSAPFVPSTFALVSSNLLYPPSLANAITGMAFSPNFTLLIPPIYDASLSSFSIFAALIIDILILANLGAVGKIGAVRVPAIRARAYLAMPVTGIALGASCCMSLPILLSVAVPALTVISSLTWVFYVTYFVLPTLAAVVLKLNLDLAMATASRALRLGSTPSSRQ